MSAKYRAFLSYSHADRRWARWLHRALEAYRPPAQLRQRQGLTLPDRLAPIFRDRDELPSASSLSEAVRVALRGSDKLIVICSPAAAASKWVNEEIREFRRLGRGDDILCVIVDGEPQPDAPDNCFPPALTDAVPGDPQTREPVAADARDSGDGRRNALLKVAAGLLDVGFDDLKQRDLRRRHRKLAVVTTASVIVSAVTIALAVFATLARDDARFRQAQAEDLVDFMLGDLMENLREIGRLDIYLSIGDKALNYFEAQRDQDVNHRTLAQRAKNLHQIGEARFDQGNLQSALQAFESSLSISQQLASDASGDTPAKISLANSHFYVGLVHWQLADLSSARHQFERAAAIVDSAVALDPENSSLLIEQGYAHTNLGRVLELEGAYGEALSAYEFVMQVNQHLQRLDPENPEWPVEVGFAHNNVGKVYIALGQLDEAERHYREDLRYKSAAYDGDPRNNRFREYLGVSQYHLGTLLAERGKFDEGRGQLEPAATIFRDLLVVDAARTNWLHRLANIERELARVYAASGEAPAARQLIDSSVAGLDGLWKGNEQNAGWRRDLARSLRVQAAIAGTGPDDAADRLDRALDHLLALIEVEPTNLETRHMLLATQLDRAERRFNADPGRLAAASGEILEQLDTHFAGSADPRVMEVRARALAANDRRDESARIAERLREIGYYLSEG